MNLDSDKDSDDDIDDGYSFNSLFKTSTNTNDQPFYFHSYSIKTTCESTEIVFRYSFNDSIYIQPSLILPFDLSPYQSSPQSSCKVHKIIQSIGLCVLLWFWMGFASKIIVISSTFHLTSSEIEFWQDFYDNITSEFLFKHRLMFRPKIVVVSAEDSDGVVKKECQTEVRRNDGEEKWDEDEGKRNEGEGTRDVDVVEGKRKDEGEGERDVVEERLKDRSQEEIDDNSRVLLPVGGGKDSLVGEQSIIHRIASIEGLPADTCIAYSYSIYCILDCVAWLILHEQGINPNLIYIADRLDEYEENNQLQTLIETLQTIQSTRLHVLTHNFDCPGECFVVSIPLRVLFTCNDLFCHRVAVLTV